MTEAFAAVGKLNSSKNLWESQVSALLQHMESRSLSATVRSVQVAAGCRTNLYKFVKVLCVCVAEVASAHLARRHFALLVGPVGSSPLQIFGTCIQLVFHLVSFRL